MGWCYLLNFHEVPKGEGSNCDLFGFFHIVKALPEKIWGLGYCKILYVQIVYCSVKMHNNHSTWDSLGAEGIIREFLSPWRKRGIDRKQKFCIISPETDFSVLAQINRPTASISDVTLSYSSSSLIFPVPIHFSCLRLHHSVNYHMFLIHLIGKIRDHA